MQLREKGIPVNSNNVSGAMMLVDFPSSPLPITLANLNRIEATIRVMDSIGNEIGISSLGDTARLFLAEQIFLNKSSGVLTANDKEEIVSFATKLLNVQTQLEQLHTQSIPSGSNSYIIGVNPNNFKIAMVLADYGQINRSNFNKIRIMLEYNPSINTNKTDAEIAFSLALRERWGWPATGNGLAFLKGLTDDQKNSVLQLLKQNLMDSEQITLSKFEALVNQAKAQTSARTTGAQPAARTTGAAKPAGMAGGTQTQKTKATTGASTTTTTKKKRHHSNHKAK